jgi:hypothetical protein
MRWNEPPPRNESDVVSDMGCAVAFAIAIISVSVGASYKILQFFGVVT